MAQGSIHTWLCGFWATGPQEQLSGRVRQSRAPWLAVERKPRSRKNGPGPDTCDPFPPPQGSLPVLSALSSALPGTTEGHQDPGPSHFSGFLRPIKLAIGLHQERLVCEPEKTVSLGVERGLEGAEVVERWRAGEQGTSRSSWVSEGWCACIDHASVLVVLLPKASAPVLEEIRVKNKEQNQEEGNFHRPWTGSPTIGSDILELTGGNQPGHRRPMELR